MSEHIHNQASHVSDTAFAREMWQHAERGNIEGAMTVRDQWKYSKATEGYGQRTGPLTAHEIGAFADKHRVEGGIDLAGFARAVERAALIKAYTLLPELRQAEHAKHHRRYFRDGLDWGLAIYSGAIRTLAMGQVPTDADWEVRAKPAKPRNGSEIARLEQMPGAENLRPEFEEWAGKRQFDLQRHGSEYTNIVTAYAWMGWLGANLDKGGCNGQG